jgi:hypothetical protein
MRIVKTLKDLTDHERSVIAQALVWLHQLPEDPYVYLRAIGQLREEMFGIRGRSRGERPSVAEVRKRK